MRHRQVAIISVIYQFYHLDKLPRASEFEKLAPSHTVNKE